MRLIRVLSSVFAALLATCPSIAGADAVVTSDATQFGTVLSTTADGVRLRSGCSDTGTVSSLPWSAVLFVRFDGQCAPHDVALPTAGLTHCATARQHVFKVRFAQSSNVVYAKTVTMERNGLVRIVLAGSGGILTADRSRAGLASVQPADVCPSAIPSSQSWPVAYCYDPMQLAVNWSPVPVSDNRIFTRGSSLYVDSRGPSAADPESLRAAFSTALALWASSLAMNRDLLDDQLKAYVGQSTSASQSFRLFVPPQVVRVKCAENALMVVIWLSGSEPPFGPGKQDLIALSQLQGRTLLLNAHDNQFAYRPDFARPVDSGHVNLVSVFVHELGHSFGLPDRGAGTSVMNPDYVTADDTKAVEPTRLDVADFARVLRESIVGTRPGFFNAADCAGLTRHRNVGST